MKTENVLTGAYVEEITGDTIIALSEQCLDCKNLNNDMVTCKAFENGIPEKILTGGFDHTKSFPNDNGILFEEVKK